MRNYIVGLALIGTLLLSGCNFGTSIEEELSNVMTELNKAEEKYRSAQSDLNKLEKSEQALFNEMMELTQEEEAELKAKVEEAEESLAQRLTHIEEEEASIKKAVESVATFDEIIEKAEDDTKTKIQQLKDAITNRYDFHSVFIAEYKKLTDLQKDLYEMLSSKETEIQDLQEQVSEVNDQNEIVKAAIKSFNDETVTVNKLKEDIFSHLEKE